MKTLPMGAEALRVLRAHPHAIGGYACVFNTVSVMAAFGPELVKPRAFAQALGEGGWFLWVNHIWGGQPWLASMSDGTLHAEADHYGLWFEAQLPDDDRGARLLAAVRRREITGVSTGASGKRDRVVINGISNVTTTNVWEISLLSPPCQPARVGTWVRPLGEARRDRLRLWRLAS